MNDERCDLLCLDAPFSDPTWLMLGGGTCGGWSAVVVVAVRIALVTLALWLAVQAF
jgi:hypothetical protein